MEVSTLTSGLGNSLDSAWDTCDRFDLETSGLRSGGLMSSYGSSDLAATREDRATSVRRSQSCRVYSSPSVEKSKTSVKQTSSSSIYTPVVEDYALYARIDDFKVTDDYDNVEDFQV